MARIVEFVCLTIRFRLLSFANDEGFFYFDLIPKRRNSFKNFPNSLI